MAGTLQDHARRCLICNRLSVEIEDRFDTPLSTRKITQYAFGLKPVLMNENWDEIPNPDYKQIDICRADLNLMKRIQSKINRALTPDELIEFTRKHRSRLNAA